MPSSKPGFSVCAGHNSKPKNRIARTLRNVMVGIFFIRLIGKSLLALRGVGPESEAESVRFHGRRVTKVGPEVKHRAPQGAGKSRYVHQSGLLVRLAENMSSGGKGLKYPEAHRTSVH